MSNADDIAKLRALTESSLDESVASFLLEISGGSVQGAAAQWREQQGGYDSQQAQAPASAPVPVPAAASLPPLGTTTRTSLATSAGSSSGGHGHGRMRRTITSNTTSSGGSSSMASPSCAASVMTASTTTTSGGRRRGKASIVGNLLLETGAVRLTEPGMSVLGPSMEPGGGNIVRGRDRGFARFGAFLDEGTLNEPKMFTDQQQLFNSSFSGGSNDNHNSMSGSNNNNHQSSTLDYTYGFSTPGAYNETEEGNGYICRERRESTTFRNSTGMMGSPSGLAAGRNRRVSEQIPPVSSPLVGGGGGGGGNIRRCVTDSTSRRRQEPQQQQQQQFPPYGRRRQQLQLQPQQRQESWTGRSIYANQPAGFRSSTMSIVSDVSMGDTWLGSDFGIDDPDIAPAAAALPPEEPYDIMDRSNNSTRSDRHSRRRGSAELNYASEPPNNVNNNSSSLMLGMRRSNTVDTSSIRRRELRSSGGNSSSGTCEPGMMASPRGGNRSTYTASSPYSNNHYMDGSNTTNHSLLGGLKNDADYDDDNNSMNDYDCWDELFVPELQGNNSNHRHLKKTTSNNSSSTNSNHNNINRKYAPIPPPGEPPSSISRLDSSNSGGSAAASSRKQRHSSISTLTAGSAAASAAMRDRSSYSTAAREDTIPEENPQRQRCRPYSPKPDPPGETMDTKQEASRSSTPASLLTDDDDDDDQLFPPSSPIPPSVEAPDYEDSTKLPAGAAGRRQRSITPRRARRGAAIRVSESTTKSTGCDETSSSPFEDHFDGPAAKDQKLQQQFGKERGRARATQPGIVRVGEPTVSSTIATSSMSLEPNSKVQRAPATGGAEQQVPMPRARRSSLSKSEQDSKLRARERNPATRPGAVSVSRNNKEPDSTQPAASKDVKVRRVPATTPGVVSVSSSIASADEPNNLNNSEPPPLQPITSSQKDMKARRKTPASRPGAVLVSNEEPPTISESTSSLSSSKKLSPQNTAAAAAADVKVRRAPATRAGAVAVSLAEDASVFSGVSGASSEPPRSISSNNNNNNNGKDTKVRRAPATAPGAVCVSPEEPQVSDPGGSSMDASQQSCNDSTQNDHVIGMPAARKGRHGLRSSSQNGLASSINAALQEQNVKEIAGRSLVFFKNKPGAPRAKSPLSLGDNSSQGGGRDAACRSPASTTTGTTGDEALPERAAQDDLDANQDVKEPQQQQQQQQQQQDSASVGQGWSTSTRAFADTVGEALREEKEKEIKAVRGLKFFAKKPGAIIVTPPTKGGEAVMADTSSTNAVMKDQSAKELRQEPGGGIKVTNSLETESKDRDAKEKEKAGLGGRRKPTAPGVVHVSGSDKVGDQKDSKDSKDGKGLKKLFGTSRPGAVSVVESSHESAAKTKKGLSGSGLTHKTSSLTTSSEAADDIEETTSNGDDDDPTMETPEDDQTEVGEEESMASYQQPLPPGGIDKGERSPTTRLSPANVPSLHVAGGDHQQKMIMADPLRGITTMAPPVKDRKASNTKNKSRGILGGLFKSKKGKKKSSNSKVKEDLQAIDQETLARMGTSRAYPTPNRADF